jgi:hypothetical protein
MNFGLSESVFKTIEHGLLGLVLGLGLVSLFVFTVRMRVLKAARGEAEI